MPAAFFAPLRTRRPAAYRVIQASPQTTVPEAASLVEEHHQAAPLRRGACRLAADLGEGFGNGSELLGFQRQSAKGDAIQ